jgi:hypothetical protein
MSEKELEERYSSEDSGEGKSSHGNTKLPYGLAKEKGINTDGMTPRQVWDALKKYGITPQTEYARLKSKYEADQAFNKEAKEAAEFNKEWAKGASGKYAKEWLAKQEKIKQENLEALNKNIDYHKKQAEYALREGRINAQEIKAIENEISQGKKWNGKIYGSKGNYSVYLNNEKTSVPDELVDKYYSMQNKQSVLNALQKEYQQKIRDWQYQGEEKEYSKKAITEIDDALVGIIGTYNSELEKRLGPNYSYSLPMDENNRYQRYQQLGEPLGSNGKQKEEQFKQVAELPSTAGKDTSVTVPKTEEPKSGENSMQNNANLDKQNKIKELVRKYSSSYISEGPNAGKMRISKKVEPEDMPYVEDMKSYLREEYEGRQRVEEERQKKIKAIEGLDELENAIGEWRSYDYEFSRRFDNESLSSISPRRPKSDINEIKKQYPRAAAYLKARAFSDAHNYAKAAAGKKALERIINGEDYNKVIQEMEEEWSKAASEAVWNS